jgi:hypothetical protein
MWPTARSPGLLRRSLFCLLSVVFIFVAVYVRGDCQHPSVICMLYKVLQVCGKLCAYWACIGGSAQLLSRRSCISHAGDC